MKPNVDAFQRDALENRGYVYTRSAQPSSRMAVQRAEDLLLESAPFSQRRVLDAGCGDGYFTIRFWDKGSPREYFGADAAPEAIQVARKEAEDRPIKFLVSDVHKLPFRDNAFDLVVLQSVLHHDDHPQVIIQEALRLAPELAILEPNGLNPGLKIIEKLSRYHREHQEKSYFPSSVRHWIHESGGQVVKSRLGGFVPKA